MFCSARIRLARVSTTARTPRATQKGAVMKDRAYTPHEHIHIHKHTLGFRLNRNRGLKDSSRDFTLLPA